MAVTVRDVAGWLNGSVVGDGDVVLQAARPLSEALPGDLTLLETEKYAAKWKLSTAAAAVVPHNLQLDTSKPLIVVAEPLEAFAEAVLRFRGRRKSAPKERIDPTARIHPTAAIGEKVTIGAYCVVGADVVIGAGTVLHPSVVVGAECKLGCDVILHPHVVLYDDVELGDRVIVHAGSVIGSDGFGYRTVNGQHRKVPQIGGVIVESDVEIGAGSTIDCGTFTPTRIGQGTKIDNHVQIGHNCTIGRHNIFCSQVGIAGSCKTGDYVVMAGQVGIGDHVTMGDDVVIGAQSGVVKDVPSKSRLLGAPAIAERDQRKVLMSLVKLPDIRRDVKQIKKHLGWDDVAS